MNIQNKMMNKEIMDKNMPNMIMNQFLPTGQQANFNTQGQLPQEVYPPFNANQNYYQEFWRIYLQNELLISQMKDYVKDVTSLKTSIQAKTEQLHSIQRAIEQNQRSQGKKKNRRVDAEIQKSFLVFFSLFFLNYIKKCPYPNCGKSYATEVSMNLHIKLKHKGGNKTEREKYARQLLQASESEKLAILEELNLPPGYLDQIKSSEVKKNSRHESNSVSQFPADSSQFIEQSADKGANPNNIN